MKNTSQTSVLIDGFNLIYQVHEARKFIEKNNLSQAIQALIYWLRKHVKFNARQYYLFFDGKKQRSDDTFAETIANIHINYSHEKSADTLIKEFIDNHPNQQDLLLISSDRALIKHAQYRACHYQKSEDYAKMMQEKAEVFTIHEEKPTPNPADTQYWQSIFYGRAKQK